MPTAEQAQRISLAFAWDGVLLLGLHALSNRRHSHAPATLLIGLDGPFQIAIGDQPPTTVEAVLLAPNTVRATESQGTRLVDLLVDPDAEACRSVRAALAGRLHCRLERQRFDAVAPEMERLFRTDCSAADATKVLSGLLQALPVGAGADAGLDQRIQASIAALRQALPGRVPGAAELAHAAGLSESRFLHLFKAQTRSTYRQYVQWLRLQVAVRAWAKKQSLAEIATEAGFADQAHFTRTLRRLTDFVPSTLTDTRRFECRDCSGDDSAVPSD